ncbi:HAD family hydrolase [Halocatena marina]
MTHDSILFDLDGVLLCLHPDHPTVYQQAIEATFEEFDVTPVAADLDAFTGGATIEEMRRVCAGYDIDFEAFWVRRETNAFTLQREMMKRGERVPYDDCVVLEQLAEQHTLGLVSSNQHATVKEMLTQFGLADLFETVYGRTPTVEGFVRTKPETHYVEQAMADLGTVEGVYVGDSACDVQAAHAAGLDAVFIRRSHREEYTLPEEPAHEIHTLASLPTIPGIASSV